MALKHRLIPMMFYVACAAQGLAVAHSMPQFRMVPPGLDVVGCQSFSGPAPDALFPVSFEDGRAPSPVLFPGVWSARRALHFFVYKIDKHDAPGERRTPKSISARIGAEGSVPRYPNGSLSKNPVTHEAHPTRSAIVLSGRGWGIFGRTVSAGFGFIESAGRPEGGERRASCGPVGASPRGNPLVPAGPAAGHQISSAVYRRPADWTSSASRAAVGSREKGFVIHFADGAPSIAWRPSVLPIAGALHSCQYSRSLQEGTDG